MWDDFMSHVEGGKVFANVLSMDFPTNTIFFVGVKLERGWKQSMMTLKNHPQWQSLLGAKKALFRILIIVAGASRVYSP
jgi:hypothetical protein